MISRKQATPQYSDIQKTWEYEEGLEENLIEKLFAMQEHQMRIAFHTAENEPTGFKSKHLILSSEYINMQASDL